MSTTPPVTPPDCHSLPLALLNICHQLPDGFSLQNVIDRVLTEAPDMLDDLPRIWALMRSDGLVQCCGIDGARFRLSQQREERERIN